MPARPEDLHLHQCIVHNTGFPPEYRLQRVGQSVVVAVRGAITANETSVVRAAALAGAGIARLPTYFVGECLADGTLQKVLPAYDLEPLDIQAVYLSRRHQPLPLRLLIDFLADRFGRETAPWDRQMLASTRQASDHSG